MDITNLTAVPPAAVYTPLPRSATVTPPPSAPVTANANTASSTRQALDEVNQEISQSNTSNELSFSVDQEIGMTIVRVVDANTKEVITQFPAEVVVRIAHALSNHKGVLFQDQA